MAVSYSDVIRDLRLIPDFIDYHQSELADARKDVQIAGILERKLSRLPGVTELRFGQLQEIEAVLNYLNIQLRKIRKKHFVKYLEHYNRALSSREAEKYVDGEDEVIDYESIINEVALIRNQYLGILKGLETQSFMLGHITRLRTAGLEDIQL